jgi:catechol 2,3-dioxygenase-like lactoylglutathione lyase family enzyme
MITGAHFVVFAADAQKARAFFRDVLDLPSVDAGGGWLIFALPPAELAAHPVEPTEHPAASHDSRIGLYLMCDHLNDTIAELRSKGVEFTSGVTEERWGSLTTLKVPGFGEIGLYQPKHPTAVGLG